MLQTGINFIQIGHADDLAYLWDIFGLNSGTNLYDFWWSQVHFIKDLDKQRI